MLGVLTCASQAKTEKRIIITCKVNILLDPETLLGKRKRPEAKIKDLEGYSSQHY